LNALDDKGGFAEMIQARDLKDLDRAFENQVHQVLAPLDLDREKVLAATKKYEVTDPRKQYDYIVIDNNIDWSYPDAAPRPYVIESGAGKYMYPSDIPLYFSRQQFFDELNVRTVTIVSCRTPRPSRILQFDSPLRGVKKVLFLRVCNDPERVDKILAMGPQNYVNADKSSEFIEFNLAGLRVVKKQKGELQGALDVHSLGRWLEWQGMEFENLHATYRPLAAYDGVSRMRLQLKR
jgi:hypothetical protein